MMALDNCFLFSHQPSFDWDPHSFGAEDLHGLISQPPPLACVESPASSETSTGYLQDAVAGWSDRCKRRRADDQSAIVVAKDIQDFLELGFWDSNCHNYPFANVSCMIQDHGSVSDDPWSSFMPFKAQEGIALHELPSSPSYSQGRDTHDSRDSRPCPPMSTLMSLSLKESRHERRKKKKGTGVVYPFVVVKPGGLEGDVTLADINERILMRPTRPMRHPVGVGEFACGPGDGPGLSGKAVVGFTRIHTQGRGTITIIRTRG